MLQPGGRGRDGSPGSFWGTGIPSAVGLPRSRRMKTSPVSTSCHNPGNFGHGIHPAPPHNAGTPRPAVGRAAGSSTTSPCSAPTRTRGWFVGSAPPELRASGTGPVPRVGFHHLPVSALVLGLGGGWFGAAGARSSPRAQGLTREPRFSLTEMNGAASALTPVGCCA